MKKIITVKMLKNGTEMTINDFANLGIIPVIEKVGKKYEADKEMIGFLSAAIVNPDVFLDSEYDEISVPNMKKFFRFMNDLLKEVSTPAAYKYINESLTKVMTEDEETE